MNDRIAKQKLNLIVLVDTSKSMQGERINQVNHALSDIKNHLIEMENDNSNMDFYITLIPFSTESNFYHDEKCVLIDDFKLEDLKAYGWSNLHLGLEHLKEILNKESKGGIMPDFGGVAPIILLLTDGHPTSEAYKKELNDLLAYPWFKVALRYGIAIELNDDRTKNVLKDFVGSNGDVIECFDANLLKKIIKIIVLTASKVKSSSKPVQAVGAQSVHQVVQQQISQALEEVDDWEW